jgi:meiotic recombination protein DMC1
MSKPIETLKNYNISEKDIERLKSIGITTIQSLYMTRRKNLLNIKGFTEKKISNIFTEANKIEVYNLFLKGSDFMNERDNTIFKISSGSNNLDNIIGGGLESNSITEIIGEYNTNINEFIHILMINGQKMNKKNIIFFDLDKSWFCKEKINLYAKGMNLNGKKCLGNIMLINDIDCYDELMDKLNEISESEEIKQCSLLIIDSLISIFQKIFQETINNSTNSQFNIGIEKKIDIESKLGQVLNILKRISQLYNIAIVMTRFINNDENINERNDLIKSDPNIEIILNYECKTRLKFKKIKNDKIKCIILNSPMISEKECKFLITEKGIQDC